MSGGDNWRVAATIESHAADPQHPDNEKRQPAQLIAFQMAEVAIPPQMFQEILRLIAELRPQPPPAPA
jgi:hypothetical protein